ncbi:hypothetical protein [Streptomyces sp. NBC_00989]|uniref:hypothetical protein n=1 Tax=Streptomyces sp. NBC_00989 TaxID=2903705 RepID=UPI00386C748C|nr:hypothetical protein OG714_00160 [Streptomyces sp. NBC_00989]WSW98137.1 hypothetical protein OG714_53980 [Streptomyces sp. NBC_00989]
MTEPEGIVARAEELLLEGAQARHADRNLARLRAKDPDAARVLTVGFVDALMDSELYTQQGEEHRRYYALKMESDETHLWDELFAGMDEIE